METAIKEHDAAMEKTEGNIKETTEAMEEAKEARDEERADYMKAMQDDRDAVGLLGKAIAALTQFYVDNNIPLGLAQQQSAMTRQEEGKKKPKKEKQMSAGFGSGYQGAKG